MGHPVWWGVDVAVHDRRRASNAERMRRLHDLLPGVRWELALREDPPHVVVQDLRCRTRDGPESAFAALLEEVTERDPQPCGAVEDLHGAEGVDVDPGDTRLHRVQQLEVELA